MKGSEESDSAPTRVTADGSGQAHHENRNVGLVDISPDSSETPALRVFVMQRGFFPVASPAHPFAPGNKRSPRVVGMTVAVIPDGAHSVVCRKDKGRVAVVIVKVVQQLDGLLDDVIDDADVAVILWAVGTVRVPCRVEAEEVLKEDDSGLVKFGVKDRVRTGIAEKLPEVVEYPEIKMDGVRRKVFRLFIVAECLHAVRVARTQLEHG